MVKHERREQGAVRTLFASSAYRRLLVGQAVSSLGDWVGTFALVARAFELTGSPTAVGAVLVLRLVPPVVASPLGGVLADRIDRRAVLVVPNVLNAGLIALVPFLGLPFLYVIAFVTEFLALLSQPARDATVPDLVPPETLPQANGIMLGALFGVLPPGAALFSGLRLASEHVPTWIPLADALRDNPLVIPFVFDAATFLFAAAVFATLPEQGDGTEGPLNVFSGLGEAWRVARSTPTIRGLATGVGVAMFGGGVLFALGIAYIRETLGGGDVEFGFLASLWGAGMGIGIAIVQFVVRGRGERVAFRSAVVACGAILVAMAFLPFLWLAFVAALVFGMAFSVALMLAVTLVQRTVEEEMRGRLLGGAQMLFRVTLAAGALGVGGAASAVERVPLGPLDLDGNQFGFLVGGALILAGAAAARGIVSDPTR